MTDTKTHVDTSTQAIKQLAETCKEQGDIAHERPGCSGMMRALWRAEDALLAVTAERDRLREAAEKVCQSRVSTATGGIFRLETDIAQLEAVLDETKQEPTQAPEGPDGEEATQSPWSGL